MARPEPTHWEAASNNHVLNSFLMRGITAALGVQHLTVRGPALIGAAVYLAASFFFCLLISDDFRLRLVLFGCLSLNPFVMDYLVAARGYSMALGFSMWALLTPLLRIMQERRACIMASVCAGLSFAANFSFAFFNGAIIGIHALLTRRKLIPWLVLPGAVVTFALTGHAVATMGKGQLWYGAKRIGGTLHSILGASYPQPNTQLVNPMLMPFFERLRQLLPWMFVGAFLLRLPGWFADGEREKRRLTAIFGGIFVLTLSLHLAANVLQHLKLPQDRTALFFVPVLTMLAGTMAAARARGRFGEITRVVLAGVLTLHAVYFLFSGRMTYFREWYWNAESRQLFDRVLYYHDKCGVQRFATTWMNAPTLNFYKRMYGREDIPDFIGENQLPPDRDVYIASAEFEGDFPDQQKLNVVYTGPSSKFYVAIRPELSGCETRTLSLR